MSFLFEENKIPDIPIFSVQIGSKNIRLNMARLDMIHPVVSGNKLFKLHYFLKKAIDTSTKNIVTFGGAYSNHLAATAFAARECGLKAIGIVRGERSKKLSHTLEFCLNMGMKLECISREDYRNNNDPAFISALSEKYDAVIIPEGGFHPDGCKGSSRILNTIDTSGLTHIVVPVGTATTFAGLAASARSEQRVLGFPVLKNMTDIDHRMLLLTNNHSLSYDIIDGYHFGGYAKWNDELIAFMNRFFLENKIPLDFIYTAKMMYGVIEKIQEGYFPAGSNIVCLHTGGLQGNRSLPAGTLIFNS